jgi:ornithine carbamoyltransferase
MATDSMSILDWTESELLSLLDEAEELRHAFTAGRRPAIYRAKRSL